MKVLFISSMNRDNSVSPVVKAQGDSLCKEGCIVEYFTIRRKGVVGYLKEIFILKSFLKDKKYDVVHAHFSYSGFLSTLAGAKPLIVSLMGSDVYQNFFTRQIIHVFHQKKWKGVIVKSVEMKMKIGIDSLYILPNGVNTDLFHKKSKEECLKKLKWNTSRRHLLFLSDPKRIVKNFNLAKDTFDMLKSNYPLLELHTLGNVPFEQVPIYMNAADVVLLTSKYEGSPNVIKEAMACNVPIVSTNVGDVNLILDGVEGCYIASATKEDVANKLLFALNYAEKNIKTNSREKIIQMGLSSSDVARKLKKIYENVL